MRDVVVFAVALAAALAAMRHPYIGVLGWTWVSLMNPHRLAWGWVYDFPIAYMLAVATLIGLVISRDRKHFPLTPVTVTLGLFVLWMCVTSSFAIYPDQIGEQFSKVMKIQLMIMVTLALIHTREQIHRLVWVIAASLAFFGVKGGLFTLATGGGYRVWGPPGTFIGDNNHVALALVMTVPLLYFLFQTSVQRWLRYGLLAAMVLTVLAALGTHSRGGLLAAVAMAAVLWWRSGHRMALALPLAAVGLLVLSLMPQEWWERMYSIADYEQDRSAVGRINAWSMAWNLALDRVTGGGFYVFTQELFTRYSMDPSDGVRAAHSIYFQILGEHGFIGLSLFLLLWFLAWRDSSWLIKNGARLEQMRWAVRLAAMVQVSFIGFLVGGAFLSLAYFDLSYLLAVILVATRELVQREMALAGASEPDVGGPGHPATPTLGRSP